MTDTATTSEPSPVPPRKCKNARKRNAASRAGSTSTVNLASTANPASTANLASMANPSQVTMDGQLKEILASMQKEIAEIRGEDESVRGEIERITNENESLHRDNERIDYDLAVIRKDLDAARVQHTQDFEALREVTMSLVPLHLPVLLDRARRKGLEHLGHDGKDFAIPAASITFQIQIVFF